MSYEAQNLDHLLGTAGFSDRLLRNHFALYRGYVTNVNVITDLLGAKQGQKRLEGPEYSELKRRFAWEFDGMRLHEYYFSNMARRSRDINKDSPFYRKLLVDFGSYEKWDREFRVTGAIRGIGWVVLYFDRIGDRLSNTWINEHDVGHLGGFDSSCRDGRI